MRPKPVKYVNMEALKEFWEKEDIKGKGYDAYWAWYHLTCVYIGARNTGLESAFVILEQNRDHEINLKEFNVDGKVLANCSPPLDNGGSLRDCQMGLFDGSPVSDVLRSGSSSSEE